MTSRSFQLVSTLLLVPAVAAFAQRSCPIIDVHQHANSMWYGSDGGPPRIPCVNDAQPCSNPPSRYTTDDALLQGTLDLMRQYNIVKAVVSTWNPDNVDRWLRTAPGRFVGGPNWGLGHPAPPLQVLRSRYQQGHYGILGEIAVQYDGLPPADPSLEPYFALAEELDVPVLIHTAGIGGRTPHFTAAAGDPLLLEPVLKRHPRLRIYLENAAYPFTDQMIALLYMYPQVYADLSTVTWLIPRTAFHDHLRRLVRAGFGDRLMFGSDQMIWPEAIGMAVAAIDAADFLSPEQKCDIFFNNAVHFFRFDAAALRRSSWPQ